VDDDPGVILTRFRVRRFRNVLDSGDIVVEGDVTCLVGKNESGKTALLQALEQLNAARPGRFDLEDQYPRWLLIPDRKSGLVGEALPIEATFRLEEDDRAAIEELAGDGAPEVDTITVAVRYDGQRFVTASPTETLDGWLVELLVARLPRFFYFTDYSILPGRVDLRQLAGGEPPASSSLQTAWALLQLAGTDPARLGEKAYELRKAELEAVSNELTDQVFEYWQQNEELEVVIDIDKETEQLPTGQTAVARFLEVRVKDLRHGHTGNFGQRSSGFQWFFSFLAAFSEFESQKPRVVVLLDEPALALHATAQRDFLRFIDDRLSPVHQVIYTTHSPFMVETDKLERVRIVEDKGPQLGAQVSTEVLSTDPESLFPLQAALGYDIAQHLFAGTNNLLVEGTSDFTYLTVMSAFLKSQSRTYLDERLRILPCGGVQNLPTFMALLGARLDVSVLIDSSANGAQVLIDLADRGRLDPGRLVTVGRAIGADAGDLEDVFEIDDYLKFFNAATMRNLTAAALPPGDRLVRRIAESIDEQFDRGEPADYFLRSRDRILPALSAATLDRFEQLIANINATLPR
jgi:ABC-type transport system involved in cytochrome c biogenesis ATPase subunit